jgi:phosphatidylglycerophosphate synthase
MTISVVWFLPNIINYVRFSFWIIIFTTIKTRPVLTLVLVIIAGLIDDFDGPIARQYDLTSKLGMVLDIGIDRLTSAVILVFLASKWTKFYFVFMIFLFTEMFADFTGGIATNYAAQVLEETGKVAINKANFFKFDSPIVWLD